ncbi:MAG: hypothetical protein WBG46_12530 [Nonlabens sp.]
MKNQTLFISILIAIFSHTFTLAQVDGKKGMKEGRYYVIRDTVDGKPLASYYASESAYLRSKKQRQAEIDKLTDKKKLYESNQRTQLATAIKEINGRVGNLKDYTEEMADRDKMSIAEIYAERIRKHNQMIDSQIEFYRVKTTYSSEENSSSGIEIKNDGGFEIKFGRPGREFQEEIKTTSFFSMAFGYNFIDGANLDINDFSYSNNNYFSMAFLWQTALTENQKLRLNYGIQYQTHGTELNGGRRFSPNTDQTEITNLGFQPKKAKFRQDQFVVPVQLEFGGTEKKEYEDGRVRYHQWDKWKFGIGGFAGFNTSSRIKMKYEENGRDVKETIANAFDNEAFIYGLDAYVGRDKVVAFARMNLNDIFKSGSVDGQYIAFGLRLQ